MGRRYAITTTNVAASAVQDLLAAYAGAAMAFEVIGYEIGQVSSTTAQMAKHRLIRLPATVTSGSGGSAPTPRKHLKGDAAATATARANDTVQATTGGTAEVLHSADLNTALGYQFFYPSKADRPVIGLSDAVVLSLDTALSPALNLSATLWIEELL